MKRVCITRYSKSGSVTVEKAHRVVQHVSRTRDGHKTAESDSYAVKVIAEVHL